MKNENVTHLFKDSEKARDVWNFFKNRIGINTLDSSFSVFLKSWWLHAREKEAKSLIFHTLPALICWEIWKSRNRAMFDDDKMCSNVIINQIQEGFRNLVEAYKSPSISNDITEIIHNILD